MRSYDVFTIPLNVLGTSAIENSTDITDHFLTKCRVRMVCSSAMTSPSYTSHLETPLCVGCCRQHFPVSNVHDKPRCSSSLGTFAAVWPPANTGVHQLALVDTWDIVCGADLREVFPDYPEVNARLLGQEQPGHVFAMCLGLVAGSVIE